MAEIKSPKIPPPMAAAGLLGPELVWSIKGSPFTENPGYSDTFWPSQHCHLHCKRGGLYYHYKSCSTLALGETFDDTVRIQISYHIIRGRALVPT